MADINSKNAYFFTLKWIFEERSHAGILQNLDNCLLLADKDKNKQFSNTHTKLTMLHY